MTPRPRQKGNKDLPANLYASKKNGRTYYQYKHPQTGKYTGFGTDKPKAIDASIQLNQLLSSPAKLTDRVIKSKNAFNDYLIYYRDEVIASKRINGQPLSVRTVGEQHRIIGHFIEEYGHLDIKNITQMQIADHLNQQASAEVFNKYRSLLIMVFRQAISDGLIENNLPERIIKRSLDAKKRARLSLQDYKKIYQQARPVIQNAMELSLNSLQRRSDIQTWRFDCKKDGFFYIIQSKTRKHGKSAYIRIPVSLPATYSSSGLKTLSDIIDSYRDNVACPFVIHETPLKQRRSKEKQHPFQISPKQISDGFAAARIAANITRKNPPTFHEIISLGQDLRKKQGWTTKEIQILRGHTSEKMTQHYMEDRDWTTVEVPDVYLK